MTELSVTKQLKQLIAQELDVNLKLDEIDDGSTLFEDGLGIDSIAIVELISLAEERFGIEFSDDDLVPASFASLEVLSNLIAGKLATKNA
jgi:acyl carrier protein